MLNYFKSMNPWKDVPNTKLLMENAEKRTLSILKTPYEQSFIKVGEHEINTIKIEGSVKNVDPIVLIHGFGAASGFWCCNLDFLAENYGTVWVIDMLGFGRSSRPNTENIKSIEDAENILVESINDWANQVGIDKFNLVGHSFGGYISGLYALKYPKRVSTLVFCDVWGMPSKPVDYEANMTMTRKILTKMLSIDISLAIVRKCGPGLVSKFRKDLLSKFSHVFPIEPTDGTVNVIADYIYHSNSVEPATGEHLFRSVSLPFGWAAKPLYNRIDKIDPSVNISFIYGQESWIDPTPAFLLSKEMSNIKSIQMLSRSGHHVYIDNLTEFHASILNSIPSSSRPQIIESI